MVMGGKATLYLVERMREEAGLGSPQKWLLTNAADEIERLRDVLREIVKHSDYDDPVRDMALAALREKE